MKNPVIFTASNVTNFRSGQKCSLHTRRAFFISPNGVKAIVTCRAWSIMGHATPSERVAFDSGKGQSLFCCPGTYQTPHHAHRNHATAPTPTRQVPAHTTPAPSSQAQQPHPKTSIYNNAFGKVLSVAAIGLAAFYTLNF